jgi:hypothetical protein
LISQYTKIQLIVLTVNNHHIEKYDCPAFSKYCYVKAADDFLKLYYKMCVHGGKAIGNPSLIKRNENDYSCVTLSFQRQPDLVTGITEILKSLRGCGVRGASAQYTHRYFMSRLGLQVFYL